MLEPFWNHLQNVGIDCGEWGLHLGASKTSLEGQGSGPCFQGSTWEFTGCPRNPHGHLQHLRHPGTTVEGFSYQERLGEIQGVPKLPKFKEKMSCDHKNSDVIREKSVLKKNQFTFTGVNFTQLIPLFCSTLGFFTPYLVINWLWG